MVRDASEASPESKPPADQGRATTILFYVAFATCVVIACFTNDVIFALIREHAHRSPDWPTAAARQLPYTEGDRYDQYLLASTKGAAFFACLILFGWLLRNSVLQLWPALRQRRLWTDLLVGLLIASILLFALVPSGMGRIYAYASVEPFLQHQGFFYRRILMPVLAHDLHLDGVLYGGFFWMVALSVCALASIYLKTRGLVLSRLELASLYTTGIFASALGLPGYSEILVLGFTLLAMLDFDRNGRSGIVQAVCFALALLTHESAAVLAFGTLALCWFDRRFLPHFAALLGLYLVIWLASWGFDAGHAAAAQLTGGESNLAQFRHTLPLVFFSLIAAYKLTLIAAAPAVAGSLAERRYRPALLILLALGGSVALTAIAADYTRMMAFGSFALLVALPVALNPLSARVRMALAATNLLIPTVYVSARHGVFAYHGFYGVIVHGLFGIPV
ncbi:MAG: hypothetical protein ABIO86_07890 [Sphingomonas sp.]